jgi:hypothetical protein
MNEGTQLDMDKFVANMRADAGLRAWYTTTFKKCDDEFYKWFDEQEASAIRKRVGTVVHGAYPTSKDTTVRYTIIPEKFGRPPLTIRWWFDHEFGYNIDLIDPKLESQYTLRPILQLIIGSGDVGLSYSHSTRECVDVTMKVEMSETLHRDGLLNQARCCGSSR